MKKRSIRIGLIISIILGMLLCTGCKNLKKVYWDYDCVWYSKSPYIYMPAGTRFLILEIDGISYDVASRGSMDGESMIFLDYSKYRYGEESVLWEMECKVKNDKLYLTIVEDNISNYQGKTIELTQIPYDEKFLEEWESRYE